MLKLIRLCLVLALGGASGAFGATYYVAPTGNNSNAGTQALPFATLQKAHDVAVAGDTIFMRGGTYTFAPTVITRDGTSGNPITVANFTGETPVIDAASNATGGNAYPIYLQAANWWVIKGLEIKNGKEGGVRLDNSSNNTLERLKVHHNGGASVSSSGKGIMAVGSSGNNLFLNNDSYANRDPSGGNADGFQISAGSTGNVFRGNRSWRNSDDGFDAFCVAGTHICQPVTYENNWSIENGMDEAGTHLGNGNAFKMGGTNKSSGAKSGGNIYKNNVAYGNTISGFDNAVSDEPAVFRVGNTLYNNTAWNNGNNYVLFTPDAGNQSTLKNNISFGTLGALQQSIHSFNSFDQSVTVSSGDFLADDTATCAKSARQVDGSLPNCTFLKLVVGSDLIDKGTNVGLPFTGSAPDLGAYELGAGTPVGVPPAFPGAQGGGASSLGGRGGSVIQVTNLNDSGTGSLRSCVAATGARTCVFRVGGTIPLQSVLTIGNPFLTIAGQSAPGDGIQLSGKGYAGNLIDVTTNDVVLRYLRLRKGFNAACSTNCGSVLVARNGADNLIVDHVSIQWALDDSLITLGSSNGNTFSYNLIGESLGPTALGPQTNNPGGGGSRDIDFHHNLIMSMKRQNPLLRNATSRFVNNLVYNTVDRLVVVSGLQASATSDIIKNVFKEGPLNGATHPHEIGLFNGVLVSAYLEGNVGFTSGFAADQWVMAYALSGEACCETGVAGAGFKRSSPNADVTAFPVVPDAAGGLEASLTPIVGDSRRLDCQGNWVTVRDAQDTRLVSGYGANTGIGALYTDEATVGGFPAIAAGTPCTDTDADGMPDTWESAKGLNANLASDRNLTGSNGFTNLESYLSGTAGITSTLPDVIVTAFSYNTGTHLFSSTVKNQGGVATPSGVAVGVGYLVDGFNQSYGVVATPPLAAGASANVGNDGTVYTIPNGAHTITAWVDDANRFAESDENNNKLDVAITIGTDVTPPTVSVTAPAPAATVSGSAVAVTATATDAVGVVGVTFFATPTGFAALQLGAEDTAAPYAVTWNTLQFANGTYALTAVARDAAGNTTTSSPISVTVSNVSSDVTPPVVSITAPSAGATVTGATVSVTASATDNNGVSGVQFKLDGATLGVEDTTFPYAITWDTTGVAFGPHSLSATARDAAGNTTTSADVSVNVDNLPDLTISALSYNQSSHAFTSTLRNDGTTAMGSATVKVAYFVDGVNVSFGTRTGSLSIITGNTASIDNEGPVFTIPVGHHDLSATADADSAVVESNEANNSFATTIDVTGGDVDAPQVNITNPINGALVSGSSVALSATAVDNVGVAGVQFRLDDTSNIGSEDTVSPYSTTWDTMSATNGPHTLIAVGRDTSGLLGRSFPVSVFVNNSQLKYSPALHMMRLDEIENTIGPSPILKGWTCPVPPTIGTADTGTLLFSMTLPADWMNDAAGNPPAKTLKGLWRDNAADGTGTLCYVRIYDPPAGTTPEIQATVSLTGGGGVATTDDITIEAGNRVTINSFTLRAAQ